MSPAIRGDKDMAQKAWIAALSIFVVSSPLAAQDSEPPSIPAPAAGPEAEYCMYVEPITGSRIETVQCWTRAEWADAGVDVDKDWAKEGVGVREGSAWRPVRA